ncbi:MAG TPA: NAD(P)-binding domain-containing protein [Chroococcidiopsis sp.]
MRFDTPTHLQEWENSPVCQGWITRAEALAELPNVLRVNRDPAKLEAIASTAGANARVGTSQQAAESSDVILLAVLYFRRSAQCDRFIRKQNGHYLHEWLKARFQRTDYWYCNRSQNFSR